MNKSKNLIYLIQWNMCECQYIAESNRQLNERLGAHPGEHQYGVSIQVSISLGKTFGYLAGIRNIPLTWILARVSVYVPPFISQILDFIYWTVLIFILIYFEWRDTENQQLFSI